MKTGSTNAAKAEAARVLAERRRKVGAFLRARVAQQDMARELGVSIATISRDVQAVLADWKAEQNVDTGAAVAHELATLDADEAQLRTQLAKLRQADAAVGVQMAVYDRIFRIGERRAKLQGLDAATVLKLQGDPAAPLIMRVSEIVYEYPNAAETVED